MSASVDVQSTGWDEVISGLSYVDIAFENEFTIQELLHIGKRTLEIARQIVPVKTGALRDSLQIIVDESNKKVIIGTDIGYGKYVELGTSRMVARPFLIPALLQAINEFKQEFPGKVRELVQR